MQPHREPDSFRGPGLGFWQPPIDTKDVFRALIEDELRAGRLNARHRARIVRYAAQMGLTAVEAGRLITECQAVAQAAPESPAPALRFVPVPPRRFAIPAHVAITTGVLLVVIWLMRI